MSARGDKVIGHVRRGPSIRLAVDGQSGPAPGRAQGRADTQPRVAARMAISAIRSFEIVAARGMEPAARSSIPAALGGDVQHPDLPTSRAPGQAAEAGPRPPRPRSPRGYGSAPRMIGTERAAMPASSLSRRAQKVIAQGRSRTLARAVLAATASNSSSRASSYLHAERPGPRRRRPSTSSGSGSPAGRPA